MMHSIGHAGSVESAVATRLFRSESEFALDRQLRGQLLVDNESSEHQDFRSDEERPDTAISQSHHKLRPRSSAPRPPHRHRTRINTSKYHTRPSNRRHTILVAAASESTLTNERATDRQTSFSLWDATSHSTKRTNVPSARLN